MGLAARSIAADTMGLAFSGPWAVRLPTALRTSVASQSARVPGLLRPRQAAAPLRLRSLPVILSALSTVELASAVQASEEQGPAILSSPEYVRKRVSGDGSCLFHAIAVSAGSDARELRLRAAQEVMRRKDDELNGATLGQWIEWETGMSPAAYRTHMEQGGTWGGQVELALLADAVQRSVEVYRDEGAGRFVREHAFAEHLGDPVRVVYDGAHYDALVQGVHACAGGYQGASGSQLVDKILESTPKRKFGQVVEGFPAPKGDKHTATVIWLHGLGDTGFGWAPVTESLALPYVKFLFPTAPTEAVTLNMGMEMPSWFDIVGLQPADKEDADGMLSSAAYLSNLVRAELEKGIPHDRIVIAGFSQGGAVAMTAGMMMMDKPLAGVMSLSTWLPTFVEPTDVGKAQPVLMCHGDSDPVVLYSWGKASHQRALELGIQAEFRTYRGMDHGFCPEELQDVAQFLRKCLPPK